MFCLRSTISYLLLILIITSVIPAALASDSLSYSGRLVNVNGSPVTGPVDLKFEFAYTIPAGTGAVLCSEQITNVALTNGVFHTKLDPDCTPSTLTNVLAQTPAGESLAIRVTDETHTKAYSYQALHAMPYANTAKQLSKLGATVGQFLAWDGTQWTPTAEQGTGDGTVTSIATGAGLTGGPITTTGTISIADGGVTDVKVATGITRTKLATGTANYVLINSGTGAISEVAQLPVLLGGTGSSTAAGARTNLGLGTAAVANIGTSVGAVMGADAVPVCLAFEKLQMTVGPTFSWTCVADADTADATKLPLAGGTMAGTIDMDANLIVDLATPTAPGHAVNKAYVDARTESQWTTNTTNIFYNTGNVGINQNTPAEKLDVVGNIALTGSLKLQSNNANYVSLKAPAALAASLILSFPGTNGASGNALTTDGAGNLSWSAVATTATAVGGDLSGTVANATIVAGAVNSSKISDGSIVDADIAGGAAIAQSKINGLVTELAGKEPTIAAGTALQFWRGDKSWQTLNTAAVPEVTNLYFTKPRVLGTDLLGYVSGAGAITSADTLLSAIEKLNGNIVANATAATAAFVNVTGDSMTGPLAMGNQNITGLAAPTADDHAATKVYVDSLISGNSYWLKTVNDLSYTAGNVGIGIATPGYPLHIQHTLPVTAPSFIVEGKDSGSEVSLGSKAKNGNLTLVGQYNSIHPGYGMVGANQAFLSTNAATLNIVADKASGVIKFGTGAGGGTERVRIDNVGNVGIGTSSPLAKLEINDEAAPSASGAEVLRLQSGHAAATVGSGGSIKFINNVEVADVAAIRTYTVGSNDVSLRFQTGYGTGTLTDKMTISNAGNVGIGIMAPTEKLHVSGNVAVTGSARFKSDTANFVELKAPIALVGNLTFNLPGTAGSSGNALITDGAGILSWAAVATTSSAVGGDLSGTIANAQIVAGSVGVSEIANTSITYAKLNLTDGDIPQAKVNGLVTGLAGKEPTITAGIAAQYWRGDKTWQTLNTTAVTEGTNLYFLDSRVRAALMSTYAVGTAIPLAITDTLIEALGKLEAQIIANDTAFDNSGLWTKNVTDYYYTGGNVGIGTASPVTKLNVGGPISGTYRAWMANGITVGTPGESDGGFFGTKDEGSNRQDTVIAWGDDSADNLRFIHTDSGGPLDGAEAMRIQANGLVGIGTITPSLSLHVAGVNGFPATSGTAQTGSLRVGSTVSQRVLDFGVNGATSTAWMQSTTMNSLGDANSLAINPNGGNVGIGTASPAAKLTVSAGTFAVINAAAWDHLAMYHSGAAAYFDVGGSEDGFALRVDNGGVGYPSASYTEVMRLMPSGSVGIGTATPSSYQHGGTIRTLELSNAGTAANSQSHLIVSSGSNVANAAVGGVTAALINSSAANKGIGYASFRTGLISTAADPSGVYVIATRASGDGNWTERMIVNETGQVGIGTPTPGELLEVAGNIKAANFLYSSDASLKQNVVTIKDPIEKLKQLRGVNFKWKSNDEKAVGFIAQEVEKVFPELVRTDKKTGLKSVQYANIVAVLVEGFKKHFETSEKEKIELKKENDKLGRKIATLEKENDLMNKRLNRIEKHLEEQSKKKVP